jgi:hypothetical protein
VARELVRWVKENLNSGRVDLPLVTSLAEYLMLNSYRRWIPMINSTSGLRWPGWPNLHKSCPLQIMRPVASSSISPAISGLTGGRPVRCG